MKLHKKLRLRRGRRRRRNLFSAGEYHDVVLMGPTVEEYVATYALGSPI